MKKTMKKTMTLLLLSTFSLQAAEFIAEDTTQAEKKSAWIALPYLFSTDTTGLTAGVVGIFNGFYQPQLTMVATVFGGEKMEVRQFHGDGVSTDEEKWTKGVFAGISGLRIPYTDRLFLTAMGSWAYYPNQRLYVDGSNDSERELSHDKFTLSPIQTHGDNNWVEVDFRYVLPLGESKDCVLPVIELDRGLPVNRQGYGGGLPFVTGQTILGVDYFYSHLSVDKIADEPSLASNGLRFYLSHDNTDYPDSPSRGYSFELKESVDFGWGDSTQSWNSIEFEYAHYIPLPDFSWSRQSVLALDFWTAYSPSWDRDDDPKTVIDKHRPPMWEGANLGGWNRMRAYDNNRFSDKAAIYGAVEYRVIPEWNPMRGLKWNPFPIDWFQLALYAEAGRVNKSYDADLLSDLKFDAGISLRALAAKTPIRFEMAWGDEGGTMWVMINQPF